MADKQQEQQQVYIDSFGKARYRYTLLSQKFEEIILSLQTIGLHHDASNIRRHESDYNSRSYFLSASYRYVIDAVKLASGSLAYVLAEREHVYHNEAYNLSLVLDDIILESNPLSDKASELEQEYSNEQKGSGTVIYVD